MIISLCGGCTHPPTEVRVDPRVISAPMEQRREWVLRQANHPRAAELFARDYEWILAAPSIGATEAKQLAYLFFYSTDTMGGYFDDPLKEGGRFKLTFHPELSPVGGWPVYVEAQTGVTWQEGQNEKIDTLSLIRLFTKTRILKGKDPVKGP